MARKYDEQDYTMSPGEWVSYRQDAATVPPEELREAAAALGRRGGQSRSAAKQQAARENGRKGGRPVKMKFFDPLYPAQDGRDTIPDDEAVARLAYSIIRGDDETIWHARDQGIDIPTPNKSARIYSRQRNGMGFTVTVQASANFFDACRELRQALTIDPDF